MLMLDHEDEKTSEKLRQAVWAIAGTLLMGIGVWTANTLSTLSTAVQSLEKAMVGLRKDVERLPPRELYVRLDYLDHELAERALEDKRLQQQIDVLEEWMRDGLPHAKKPKTKPYARE